MARNSITKTPVDRQGFFVFCFLDFFVRLVVGISWSAVSAGIQKKTFD